MAALVAVHRPCELEQIEGDPLRDWAQPGVDRARQ